MSRKLVLLLIMLLAASSLLSLASFRFVISNIEANERSSEADLLNSISSQMDLSIELLDKLLIERRPRFEELHRFAKDYLLNVDSEAHDLSKLKAVLEDKAGFPIEVHIVGLDLKIAKTTYAPDLGLDFSSPHFNDMQRYLEKVRETGQIAIGQPNIELVSKQAKIYSMSVLDEASYLELGFIDPDVNQYFRNLHDYSSSKEEPQIQLFAMFWNGFLIPVTFDPLENPENKLEQYEQSITQNPDDVRAFQNVLENDEPFRSMSHGDSGSEKTHYYIQLAELSNPLIPEFSTRYLAKISFDNEQVRFFKEELERFLVLSLVFSIALLIVSAIYIRHWIVSPLRSLHSAIQKKSVVQMTSPLLAARELSDIADAYNTTLMHLNKNVAKLEQLSNKDSLTSLYNRRKFSELFEKEVARAGRSDSYLALAMIDVDNFKKFNDQYGHLEGDDLLADLAKQIKQRFLRPSDCHCRMGGDEFSVLLVDIDPSTIASVFEDLRETWDNVYKDISLPDDSGVSVSIGVYVFSSASAPSWKDAYKQADAALYAAKEKGRDLVEVVYES